MNGEVGCDWSDIILEVFRNVVVIMFQSVFFKRYIKIIFFLLFKKLFFILTHQNDLKIKKLILNKKN